MVCENIPICMFKPSTLPKNIHAKVQLRCNTWVHNVPSIICPKNTLS